MDEELWYREAIIYEVHIRSFFDSDGDGIGDLRGLTQRLDYIQELGVTALWLLPFYPSPLKDDGYDIASYTEIHPDYGTLGDFQAFLREAHRRGLKVITELVLNHTSDQHPWFQRARRAPRGSVERDFYVWSDTPDRYKKARIIFSDIKDSNWSYDPVAGQYYWHRFYDHQPDLNFDNPRVRSAVYEIVDFWFEMGIDGLRLDAITYLYEREGTTCESLPETHAFLRELRAHLDEHYDNRLLLAEANQWPEDAIDYFGDGDECHMTFHFPLMPRLFMAVEMEDSHPIVDILEQTPEIPENCQWALFLRNHDELTLEMVTDEERDFMYRNFAPELRMRVNLGIRRRLAPLLRGNTRKIQLLYSLLLSLPGTPIIYYGDEIAMGDNYHLGDRDGVRTPMQWSADRNAGFSRANPQSLFLPVITDPGYHYLSTNVETQENNSSSLLRWLKRLIAIRNRYPALSHGNLRIIPCTNHRVLAFTREMEHQKVLIVVNLSGSARHLHLDLSDYVGAWPIEKWGRTQFPPITESDAHHYALSLGPYDFFWFDLADQPLRGQTAPLLVEPTITLEVREEWTEIFEGRLRTQFERHLSTYLSNQNWFNPRSRTIDSIEVSEHIRLRWESGPTVIALVEVRYLDGDNELYVLPFECTPRHGEGETLVRSERAAITELVIEHNQQKMILFDAASNPIFANALAGFIRKEWKINGIEGSFQGHWLEQFHTTDPDELERLSAQLTNRNHSHTSMIFGKEIVMKLFRRLERGLCLDVEMGKFLQERHFQGAAALMGHLDYHRGRWEPTTLITVHKFVPHDTDGWTWFCDSATSFLKSFEDQDQKRRGRPFKGAISPNINTLALRTAVPSALVDTTNLFSFFESARQLGRRTSSLHRALATGEVNTPFEPIPFNKDYERARYHAMRALMARTFRLLRRQLPYLDTSYDLARWVLEHDHQIDLHFQQLISRGVGGLRLRIHGDYHLEELMRTDDNFIIIDFEGHPWLPLSERRIKRSPLRDVASMMRSFHHACLVTLQQHLDSYHIGPDDPRHTWFFHRAQALYAASSSAFLNAYLEEQDAMEFLPPESTALETLLDTLRLKKAIQQLSHDLERNKNPTVALIGVATLLM